MTRNDLLVSRLPDGGYVAYSVSNIDPLSGRFNQPLFACSTVDEMVKYVQAAMTPAKDGAS